MNNHQHYPNSNPQVGATFYPGGVDDFYMPEVISPAPQRLMPEVPENMQQNLAQLEQQAHGTSQYGNLAPVRHDSQSSHGPYSTNDQYSSHNYQQGPQVLGQYNGGESYNHGEQTYDQAPSFEPIQQPNFSLFPVLRNSPPNVPPTAEKKEASLDAARQPVLASNDLLNQLEWAQDALAYVEETIQNEQRTGKNPLVPVRLSRAQQLLKDDAIKVILFLAQQGHPRALVLNGIWLEFGKFDFPVDKKQAWESYKTAVRNAAALNPNDPTKKWGGRAQYRIGMQFENSKDIANALKHYQLGVETGDSAACYRLGMMVLLGQHGQLQDYQQGLSLVFAAAQNADENAPQGAYVLGMLQAGELPQVRIPERFLARDINQAKINIERAAFLGFAKAQVKMGSAYELSELGCDFDPALSLHYNNLAARQGEVEAEMAISKWFLAGHDGVFAKDEEMAFVYAQRAAQDGLPTAQFAMGYFNEIGIYVPVNLHAAKDWYQKAAENGNADAAGRIDSLSRSKTLSRRDHERIAVSKIKESRLQSSTESVPPMPPMPALVDMPDPSRMSIGSPTFSGSDQFAQRRPQSVAPYPPNSDFGPSRPGLISNPSNMSNPEMRPSSAFGINPNLRPSSVATIAGSRAEQHSRHGLQDQGRPYSNYDQMSPGHGRGGRRESGPPQQIYPGPGRGAPQLQGRLASPQPPPKIDIGFLAPIDSSGSDGRNRVQKSDSPLMGRPPGPNSSSNQQAQSFPQRSSSTPNSHSPVMGNNQRFPKSEPMPQKALPQPSRPPSAAVNKPPAANTKRPGTSAAKPAPIVRPPGKGPKTFEEMGVPAGKGKDECVVM